METCNLSPHAAENLIRKMDDLESRIAKLELNEQKSEETINNQIYPHTRRSKSHTVLKVQIMSENLLRTLC